MTYATRADLETRFGEDELIQRESVLPADAIVRILAGADAEINSYVSGRYPVPLNPVPDNVINLASAIARYHYLGDAASDRARQDYEDARAYLRDIQAGKARLDVPVANAASSAETVVVVGRGKLFGGGLR